MRSYLLLLTLFVLVLESVAQPNSSPKVGVWFTLFYHRDPRKDPRLDKTVNWYAPNRDSLKTPVVGWGPDTLVGDYSSLDRKVLQRQIKAMKKAGIDFLIADVTNGLNPVDPPYQPYDGDGLTTHALKILFEANEALPKVERISISVSLGFEFWGPHSLCYYWKKWDGWDKQYARQQSAISRLATYFTRPAYFLFEGKPLVIAYLDQGLDFPPKESDGKPRDIWLYPDLTLKYAVAWRASYSATRSVGDGECVPATTELFHGIDTKGFWGWGSGAVDSESGWDARPIPFTDEHISIMPGTRYWMWEGDQTLIQRRRGNDEYFVRSWKQAVIARPKVTLINDWNNWNEETAIEGCVGQNGWTDLNGNPTYDWYLRITAAYASVLKGKLSKGVYVRQEGVNSVYRWNGRCLEKFPANHKPVREPVIELPTFWLQRNGFWKLCG